MIHINRPQGYYLGQVRRAGYQKWKTVTKPRHDAYRALAAAVLKGRAMKRARVIFIDSSGWYDPHIVMEAKLA